VLCSKHMQKTRAAELIGIGRLFPGNRCARVLSVPRHQRT